MKNESSAKENPYFDYELKKWLALYSIGNGPHKFKDMKGKMEKVLKEQIVPLMLVNAISEFQSEGCVKDVVRNDPIYKKEGNILKHLGNTSENHYFLTQKGKEKLLFGWEFAAPAIPKDFYEEISNSLCAICQI